MKRAGIIFFMFVIILTGVIKLTSLVGPVDRSNKYVVALNIKPGSSSREIGDKLYTKGLIASKTMFNLLVSIRGLDNQLQAGYYELKPSKNLLQIIDDLADGRVATFKVTIPEGYTVEEIAGRLAQLTFYSREDFLQEAREGEFNRPYLPQPGLETKYTLEGFLYPDTYIIPKEFTPYQILKVMLNQFDKKWWYKLKIEADKKEYTPYEIITIASLIEKEAKLDKEKPLIAAVIYNRLQKGMLLQIDAGIQYFLTERKGRILYRDLRIDSPYNTYLHPGLPPGPICSPGDAAIEAALNPADVDYLFYFALKDGSHKFTESYKEHLKLQVKMKKEGLINE